MVTFEGSPPNAEMCFCTHRSASRSSRYPVSISRYRTTRTTKPTILETKISEPSLLYLAPTQKSECCDINISPRVELTRALADR